MIKICQTLVYNFTLFKIKNYIIIIRETLQNYTLVINKRTNYRVHTVFNKGISIWNCLDEEIKNQKSYFSFKRRAKLNYLLIINIVS